MNGVSVPSGCVHSTVKYYDRKNKWKINCIIAEYNLVDNHRWHSNRIRRISKS